MPYSSENKFKILSGTANPSLAEKIANYLGEPLGMIEIKRFSDGEIWLQILENVRGADVFVVQPTCPPVNENLMELLLIIDALKRASAGRITAVIPYYGYARQDRKDKPRVPISSKLVADLLQVVGVNRLLFMDLHADQIMGFFNVPVDHLYASPVFTSYILEHLNPDKLVLVSPDAGGVPRTRAIAKKLACQMAIMDKRRVRANEAEILHLIGEVEGKDVLIYDDIVDTAGTMAKTAYALKEHGAKKVYACATHPVLSGPALDHIQNSPIELLLVSDTIPLSQEKALNSKIKVLSVSELFARAIRNIHDETSVSGLFN